VLLDNGQIHSPLLLASPNSFSSIIELAPRRRLSRPDRVEPRRRLAATALQAAKPSEPALPLGPKSIFEQGYLTPKL